MQIRRSLTKPSSWEELCLFGPGNGYPAATNDAISFLCVLFRPNKSINQLIDLDF